MITGLVIYIYTLLGINISHLRKRKIVFKRGSREDQELSMQQYGTQSENGSGTHILVGIFSFSLTFSYFKQVNSRYS